MLNITEFNIRDYFLDDRVVNIEKQCFFKKMEVLIGHTIADLYLKDPTQIQKALQTHKEENPFIGSKSIIEKLYKNTKKVHLDHLKATHAYKGNSI